MIDEHDEADEATTRVMNVKVVNRNDFTITDMFDGVPYAFPPDTGRNKGTTLPIDAAHHIFGWHPGAKPEEIARHVQKRMGWNTPDMVKSGQHKKFFDNLTITPIEYRMVPVELDNSGERKKHVNKLMEAADTSSARHVGA